jgi:hypothetical protein
MRRFPFGLHIPVDDLREWVVSGIAHPVPRWTDETGRQFLLARLAAADIARRYAAAGFAVAIDDVIEPAEVEALFERAIGHPVVSVLLMPRLDVALERNASRTSKSFDASILVETIRTLHRRMAEFDSERWGWLVVDNGDLGVEATVDEILRRSGTRLDVS